MKTRKRCHNCIFASKGFKIGGITHHQCNHPRHEQPMKVGAITPYDTLQTFSDTCDFHEFKEPKPIKHENQNDI